MNEQQILQGAANAIRRNWMDELCSEPTQTEVGIILNWLEDNPDEEYGIIDVAFNLISSCWSGYEEIYGEENPPSEELLLKTVQGLERRARVFKDN